MRMSRSLVILCIALLAGLGFANGQSKKDDEEIGIYELTKGNVTVKLTNWGASIVSVLLPDKYGHVDDVVLGYDSLTQYKHNKAHFGSTVGRVANRIGGAQFTLNGKHFKLHPNQGENMIHGGSKGFSDVAWEVKAYRSHARNPSIVFNYRSHDGEQGFPGDLDVRVTYALEGVNQLSVTFKAKALNKATPVNLANHAYWNLGGHNSGNILDEEVQILGSQITQVDRELIPTGKLEFVKGTPYDFVTPQTIGSRMDELKNQNGYDINYVLDGEFSNKMHRAAAVHDRKSGRLMELATTAPALQFYTGGHINNVEGKDGAMYQGYAGLCLETQAYPDAVNHPNFPSTIVKPGHSYKHTMLFRFYVETCFI